MENEQDKGWEGGGKNLKKKGGHWTVDNLIINKGDDKNRELGR